MITLKDYQKRVLTSLSGFFRQCSRDRHPADMACESNVNSTLLTGWLAFELSRVIIVSL